MSEKHLPGIGGAFDRIVFDGDGTAWVPERTCKNVSSRQTPWKCSACGGVWFHGWNFEPLEFRYCPDCGAKVVDE